MTEQAYRGKTYMAEVAALDAKGQATDEQQEYLRRPENLADWRSALVELQKALQAQFAKRKADVDELKRYCFTLPEEEGKALFREEMREYRRWKAAAGQYLASLIGALSECKMLQRQAADYQESMHRKLGWRLAQDLQAFLEDDRNLSYREETLRRRDKQLDRLDEYLAD